MGGVCSTGTTPLSRTHSELSFRAIGFIEQELKPFQSPTKAQNNNQNHKTNPIGEINETQMGNQSSSSNRSPLSEKISVISESNRSSFSVSKEAKSSRVSSPNSKNAKSKCACRGSTGSCKATLAGRVSNAGGFVKAVEGFDAFVSGMTNLTPMSSGFVSGVNAKGNKISILAFEVANTVVKGASLMQSLSKENVKSLKESVFLSEGVQSLVSSDFNELLRIVEADKRQELKVFAGEIIRFGNRCKDPQWHNLDRYFNKLELETTPQKQLKETAMADMHCLMTLVRHTSELYHEMHALDRFEQDYKRRAKEEESLVSYQRGDTLPILRQELKSQRKHVKKLKKKSLWSKILEDVIEKLVDVVHFLHLEIREAFGSSHGREQMNGSDGPQRLGPAGLALHYANIITQVDAIVMRPGSVPSSTRDTMYQGLPPSIKSALRTKLQASPVNQEIPVPVLRNSIERTLQWLLPIANNTTRAHHGFGWVGEWANTGTEMGRRQTGQSEVIKIETLYHANKEKTESYLLDLVIWLHYLFIQSRPLNSGNRSPSKSPVRSPPQRRSNFNLIPKKPANSSCAPYRDEQEIVGEKSDRRIMIGKSKSQEFDNSDRLKLDRNDRLSKSSGHSHPPIGDFEIEKIRALDVIDRVDLLGKI